MNVQKIHKFAWYFLTNADRKLFIIANAKKLKYACFKCQCLLNSKEYIKILITRKESYKLSQSHETFSGDLTLWEEPKDHYILCTIKVDGQYFMVVRLGSQQPEYNILTSMTSTLYQIQLIEKLPLQQNDLLCEYKDELESREYSDELESLHINAKQLQ